MQTNFMLLLGIHTELTEVHHLLLSFCRLLRLVPSTSWLLLLCLASLQFSFIHTFQHGFYGESIREGDIEKTAKYIWMDEQWNNEDRKF